MWPLLSPATVLDEPHAPAGRKLEEAVVPPVGRNRTVDGGYRGFSGGIDVDAGAQTLLSAALGNNNQTLPLLTTAGLAE
jgi:hypothetical protein